MTIPNSPERAMINPFNKFVGLFIPNCISQSTEISSSSKIVLGRLFQYAGRNGYAFPKRETLAAEVGLSAVMVDRCIKELVEFGLLKVIRPSGADRLKHLPNHYAFFDHPIYDETTENETPDSYSAMSPGLYPGMTPKEENQREENQGGGSIPPQNPPSTSHLRKPSEPVGQLGGNLRRSGVQNPPEVDSIATEVVARPKKKKLTPSESDASGPVSGKSERSGKIIFRPEHAPLPIKLDTPAFRAAWGEWCAHRVEIRVKLTPLAVKKQLLKLAELGMPRALAAIEHSIANGWKGIYERQGAAPAPANEDPEKFQYRDTDTLTPEILAVMAQERPADDTARLVEAIKGRLRAGCPDHYLFGKFPDLTDQARRALETESQGGGDA